ncbi:toll/interleukin-1 receptor domain-containing protein [Homoserinimonas sp. OAct 916]|uniref:toll/interleukin-1 receptor domain-containing protein n=1 Tax=Homoserinimonas sp. OAct 916 TaxID=2211450 RepID=UPI0013008848|nr:toll/interleukin-1 receptor domain-containing protein [Homoserinimonas sp. OAct 916]
MEIVAKAFLSYAHADNEREGGRVLKIAEQIRSEFETLTGTSIEIFTDKAEILWGQDFRARLNEALQETTFFIPILTPTYFLRDECRKEMRQFITSASALGLDQLLLSIRYTPVPDLREGSTDELKDLAARMQFESWDGLRLLDESSTQYRMAINRLATRLVELTQRLESSGRDGSEVVSGARLISVSLTAEAGKAQTPAQDVAEEVQQYPEEADESVDEEDEDAPGLIDVIADVEPAMEEWRKTMEMIGPATERFNTVIGAATEKMDAANSRPNSFAAKIAIARSMARDAEAPLVEIETLSKDYSTALLRVDVGVQALLKLASSQSSTHDVDSFISSLQGLIQAGRDSTTSVRSAADIAKANAGLSRDIRPVLRRFETALRNIADGMSIMDGWQDSIDFAA